jgi:putative colanic acid biosynthesis acetyltransferase WcaF
MSSKQVDLSNYDNSFSFSNKIGRIIWNVSYWILFRPFGLPIFRKWRNLILRSFGARIHSTAKVYASVKIWAPWNLALGANSCLGRFVDCYNQGKITIGNNVVISQKAYLCASSHDISDPKYTLTLHPININNQVWIATDAFIGPGVTIREGAVIGARSAVFKDVEPWTVVGGNPSRFIKKREIKP